MNYFIGLMMSFLFATHCYADNALPAGAIKVDKGTNEKCVEFISYKGEMYCTITPTNKIPFNTGLLAFDKQVIQFDNRPWKAAWVKNTAEVFTIEYIPVGEEIDNWQELVTSQFIAGLQDVTPVAFYGRFKEKLDKAGISYTIHTIEETPEFFLFEFKVAKPDSLQQDELQKVVKHSNGMYILHYAMKKADMGEENRRKWIINLKESTIKP